MGLAYINLFEESEELDDGRVVVGIFIGGAVEAEDEIPPLVDSRAPTLGIGAWRGWIHCQLG